MITVRITKPLYDTFVYVRELYINRAKQTGQRLRIITGKHERICTPQDWLTGAKRMEKVFKDPRNPMVLWGNYVTPRPAPKNQPMLVDVKSGAVFNNKEGTVRFV